MGRFVALLMGFGMTIAATAATPFFFSEQDRQGVHGLLLALRMHCPAGYAAELRAKHEELLGEAAAAGREASLDNAPMAKEMLADGRQRFQKLSPAELQRECESLRSPRDAPSMASPQPLRDPDPLAAPAMLAQLGGEWAKDMGTREQVCAPGKRRHRYEVLEGGRILIERPQPRAGVAPLDGEVIRYRVVHGDERQLTLFDEHEPFVDAETGDRIIRQLILEAPGRIGLRLLGRPAAFRAAAVVFRCAD
jgi:hypothetical protein